MARKKGRDINGWLNTEIALGDTATFYAFGTYAQRDTEGANYFRYPDGEANWPEVMQAPAESTGSCGWPMTSAPSPVA